ncbi:MAG TPA: T9SS type A sorting domain-containing protein [Bacteroidota bacterium]|nr:T9SS type A sorting domain-containing protein [Bacteroidota bacterium]
MKCSRLFALVVVIGLMLSPALLAQSTGDFRSFQNGNWNDVNSWERYNGSIWVNPAPTIPASTDSVITILSGDTIIVTAPDSIDQLEVEGVLRVRDTLIIQDGTGNDAVMSGTVIMDSTAGRLSLSSVGTPVIVFSSTSVYRHAANGGSLPVATWETGSTCEITGVTGSAPANGNQNFYNITWNNTGQTANLNLGWNGNTIGGTITVLSTGSGRWQMCAPTTGNSAIVTINGDIVQSAGNFTTNGTSNGTTTITIHQYGNVNVTGGNFSISRGSQGGTGTTTWYLHGPTFAMSNATTQNSNSAGARFFFALTDTQTVSIASSVTVQSGFNFTVDTSTTLIIEAGIDTLTGTVENRGVISPVGAITFSSAAKYVHARNAGTIPTATWAAGSTCEITGVTTTAPAGGNQNFSNVIWNCPGQASNLNMGWNGITIGGNITVTNTGSARWQMCAPAVGTSATITINGNIVQSGGQFTTNGTSNGTTTIVINHGGSINVTGGNFSISRGSQGGTGTTTWYINNGNFSMSNATTQNSNAAGAKFVFAKAGTQKLTLGAGNTLTALPIEVAAGSILELDSSIVRGSGNFTVDSGAVLGTGSVYGLDSALVTTGTKTLSTTATYSFNGTAAQVTGSLLPSTIKSLLVKNSAGVTLTNDVALSGPLYLLTGKLVLGAKNISALSVSGGSTTTYVATDGTGALTVNGIGSAQTFLAIGTATSYAPIWITNHGTVDTFTVSVAPDAVAAPAGGRVNLKWNLAEKLAGGSSSMLKFGWMSSDESAAMVSDRPNSINFFRMTDTTEIGKGYYTTQFLTEPHTAARESIDSFGPIALGRFKGTATGIEQDASLIPDEFLLQQNFPNPFNPSTTIRYDIPQASHVSIRIYDALGRMVSDLVDSDHQPGFHSVEWNADKFTSGVYYYRIVAGEFVSVKKLLLVK